MEIKVTRNAFFYLKEELSLDKGDSISIFVRYGGMNGWVLGFSLGIKKEPLEKDMGAECTVNDVKFAVAADDLWYFEDKNLLINIKNKELNFEPM